LLLTLRKARAVGARRLVILTDSELVACHIGKTYKAKKPDMMKYLQAVRGMEKFFIGITVKLPQKLQQGSRCYREGNRSARTLAPGCVLRNHNCEIRRRRHSAPKFVNAIQSEDWRAPIVVAVRGYYEAEDGVTNKRVAIRARNYHLIDDNLY
jgi:hypothetical protein